MKRYLVPALASVLVTFGLWFYTRDSVQSLIIGLLTHLTFLVIEHLQVIGKVSKYLDTHKGLIESPDMVVSAATRMRTLENSGGPLRKWIAERAFVRLNDRLGDLVGERWVENSVERVIEITEKLFAPEHCARTYRGTSIVTDYKAYWQTMLGQRYQKFAEQAIARGVTVKRIFILDDAREMDDIAPPMRAQAAAGIQVRCLLRADAPTGAPLSDYGIWDDHAAMQLSEARHAGSAFRATLMLNASDVRHLADTFDALFEVAQTPDASRIAGTPSRPAGG